MEFRVPLYRLPRQQRSRERFDQIMHAARGNIGSLAYDNLTLATIADKAGVSLHSIYRYFPDIRGVFGKLLEEFFHDMEAAIGSFLMRSTDVESWETNLRKFIKNLGQYARAHPYILKTQIICRLDPSIEIYWWRMVRALEQHFTRWVALIDLPVTKPAEVAHFIILQLDAMLLDIGRQTNKAPAKSVAIFSEYVVGYMHYISHKA